MQKRPRLGEGRGGGRGEEGEFAALRAPERQFQSEAGEVGGRDLRRRKGGEPAILAPGPEPVAGARRDPSSAAAALFGLGLRDPLGHQPRHAGGWIEAGAARAAGIDDDADILDRQRGFGDRGGKDDLAAGPRRRDGGALRGEIHRPEERPDLAFGGEAAFQQVFDAADLALAGQEDENAALGLLDRLRHQPRDRRLEAERGVGRAGEPARLDREGAAFGGDHGGGVEHRGDRLGVECRRHHEDREVGAERLAHLPAKREAEIGVEGAFVELVEDHRADAGEFGVGLQHPREDAFGHHLDPGGVRHLRLAADSVADGPAHGLAQGLGHAFGGGAGGKPAGFEHDDAARDDPFVEERERHPRGLAGPRGGLQHGAPLGPEGGDQPRQGLVYGKAVTHIGVIAVSAGLCHRSCPSKSRSRASGRRRWGRGSW